MKPEVAVITGDIIGSTHLSNQQRVELPGILKNCFQEIKEGEESRIIKKQFEIFRGDSFQGLIRVDRSLIVGLKIISYLMMREGWDYFQPQARIAIGLGNPGLLMSNLRESDGEAFRISGKLLDEMKEQEELIRILSTDKKLNETLETISLLLNVIISHWTRRKAGVIHYLLNGQKQTDIAWKLGISQPSVNQAAASANWSEIVKVLSLFNSAIE